MIRSFLPVGQGAFYLEQFSEGAIKANVIYDCGSLTEIGIVEKEIRNNFDPGEVINAVFISHLDSDHMNGLPYLLKYCHVKNIFFPLITEECRALVLLQELVKRPSQSSNFVVSFSDNPHRALDMINIKYSPVLHQIQAVGQDVAEDTMDIRQVQSGANVSGEIFGYLDCGQKDWMYIPFNFRQTARIQLLKAALQKELGEACSSQEILKLIKNNPQKLSEIKKAYQEVSGSLNTNSMTLLSASMHNEITQSLFAPYYLQETFFSCHRNTCGFTFANGCLYTGDFDASGNQKWAEFNKAYAEYSDYIGCIQIPHHGSRHNYNPNLMTVGNCKYYIISAGEKNQYRHPHSIVVKDILTRHKYPIIVTEYSGSAARFIISNA